MAEVCGKGGGNPAARLREVLGMIRVGRSPPHRIGDFPNGLSGRTNTQYWRELNANACDITGSRKRITVLLADDNQLVRREFRRILEREDDFEVVGEAKNGLQAVAMVKKFRPALVLMDLSMPLLNGLQATCQILKAAASTKVLILSVHSDDEYVKAATDSGAMGYLIKHTAADIVCSAIRAVHEGSTFCSPAIPSCLRKRKRKK